MEDRTKYLFVLIAIILIGFVSVLHSPLSLVDFRSQVAQVQTVSQVSPPTNLTASITKGTIVNLSWTAPANTDTSPITGYEIYRDGKKSTTITAPATTYTSSSQIFVPGASYCFTIASYDSNNTYSDPTAPACVSVAVGSAMAPTNLTAVIVSSNTVDLTWQYPITTEQLAVLDPTGWSGYTFLFIPERSVDGGSTWSIMQTTSTTFLPQGDTQIKMTDTHAQAGVSNMYRVTAFDVSGGAQGQGFSSPSNVATASTPQVQTVPTAPSNLTINLTGATRSQASAQLTWTDNSNDETGWMIERQVGGAWTDFSPYNHPNYAVYSAAALSLGTTYTFRVRAVNSFGRSEPTNTVEITTDAPPSAQLSWTPPVPSQNMLVIYNADDSRSSDIKNYYLNNRPLISDANVLGLHFPALGLDSGGFDVQSIDKTVFQTNILTPITSWIQSHPDKPIRYIVLIWGMPSVLSGAGPSYDMGGDGSVAYQISTSLQKLGTRNGVEYNAYVNPPTRYMPDYYRGTTALVTSIDMGSVEATKAYIDKLKRIYNLMVHKNVILSGRDAGIAGDTYYIDSDNTTKNTILAGNSSANVMYKSSCHFSEASNVVGFSTGGTHACFGQNFPTDGSLKFSGSSGWYIFRTTESWNGQRNTNSSMQSNFIEWFSANAFGGTNYSNTPVGSIAHVREPAPDENSNPNFFTLWDQGYTFAEAAWASRRTPWFLATGDPLVAISGTAPIVVTDTTPPVIQVVSPVGTLLANTTSATLSITTDENATCKYGTMGGVSYANMAGSPFTTTGAKNHSVTISGLLPGTSYVYYVRCQDTLLNANQTDFPVVFAVAAVEPAPDTTAPYVVMNYPFSGAVVPEGAITLSVSASDLVGVVGVKLYIDNHLVDQENTTSPYSKNTTISAGTHSAYAKARDAAGNIGTSPVVTFTVQKYVPLVIPPVTPPITPPVTPDVPVTPPVFYTPLFTQQDTTNNSENQNNQSKSQTFLPAKLTKNLKINDTGVEVLLLQRTLNLLGYNIATSGPQSVGNETSRFDEKTKQALIRFQNNYAESGLTPTGVLDNATMSILNGNIAKLVSEAETAANAPQEIVQSPGLLSKIAMFIGSTVSNVVNFILGWFK